ncbi:heme ABC transporter ATP-binding protein [Caldinitratiruptor microaerophilus]|uniref:ABC transporter ATP-binding protein n=1 Tax=Caldinitratiruptor microaerophilus TaxID=671077 RepID=A0AA35G6K9_9FIRM|nr:heme ABC transporter ATP-binding protein [Caldinitratiruptor microaerophilus]BDG59106.1 ABC transporter ATP-binding protein [Caldinitratiruptor microaerophilus]
MPRSETAQAHIQVLGVSCAYGAHPVLAGVTLQVRRGEFAGIVGPNGSGKTTLLRAIARVLAPTAGSVLVDGRDVARLGARALAREIGAVAQDTAVPFDFTVEEIVQMGRLPHLGPLQAEGPRDRQAVERALALTRTDALRDRPVTGLSGGERQRVLLARALAQEPRILLLDEPTAHLDVGHQVEVMDLIWRLNRTAGVTVLAVLHDLNLAAQYCDRLFLLSGGRLLAAGTPAEVLTETWIRTAYGAHTVIVRHPRTGCPQVLPLAGDAVRVVG